MIRMFLAAAQGAVLLGSVATAHATVDPVTACTRTVHDYARAWDLADGEAFGALFTDNGSLDLSGQPVVGRQAIAALPKAPNERMLFRHLMTNVSIDVVDEHTARGVSYLLLFMAPRPAEPRGPVEIEDFQSMGEYHDTFAITPDGCRIAERRLVMVFTRPRPAPPAQ